ncbi:efflux RND transporter periplasmic adaptor subunit [Mangrovimicrobium sediminis]|uniref:Efflux RND transporter periplasmic adaptor subunit n=2 Tax=Mangrovimicrobium sediminis TaxID=2562682 RepID=A0A4Z0M4C8_9GAMM|nr:efflux RND transporter periplasmic adaptor subunit [Haliea sp. SAOS-164]
MANCARARALGLGSSWLFGLAVIAITAMLSGCGAGDVQAAVAPPPPQVDVAVVQTEEVTDWNTYTGNFEAVDSVELRPRVSGYIDEVRFEEGSEVNQGEILFVIDQRPYQLQLEHAEAELARAKSLLKLARIDLERTEKLLAVKAVSKEEYDQRASTLSQYQAEYQAALTALDQAKLNLEYTEVVSPIAGRVSRAAVTRGNYVTAGSTPLTTLVSLDPIHVSFEADENSFNTLQAQIRNGSLPAPGAGGLPVQVGITGNGEFPFTARLTFIDNRLNPQTGTISVQALLPNPERLFTPGMLARVRLQASRSYAAVMLDDAAIGTDQDRKYVLVVEDGKAQYRNVEVGTLQEGRRVVRRGLQAGEQVVVSGLQRIRPGMPVDARVVQPAQPQARAPQELAFRF